MTAPTGPGSDDAAASETTAVGVVGCGRMGRAVARLAARLGRPVVLGSRSPERARAAVAEIDAANLVAGDWTDALTAGDLTFLTTLWSDLDDVVAAIQSADVGPGGVLVDCTNPEGAAGPGLEVGTTTSGAEILAGRVPGPPVVKALNHVYAELLDRGPDLGVGRAGAFLCGDDPGARERVARFLAAAGFEPVDAGPLRSARFLEPTAQLMVALIRERGHPPADVALTLLQRGDRAR